ncbi:MAG: PAS domain S-box protein, partial [Anaerolineae bacterium]|nr:PAS domain S-box protein [Anaerolineae bacterium]
MIFTSLDWKRLASSLLITAIGLIALALTDRYYRGSVSQANAQELQRTAANVQDELSQNINAQITVAEDLQAFMLAPTSLPDYETFDRFAELLLDHYPQALAFQYVDPDLIIRHIHPLEGNESALDLDLTTRPAAPFVEKAIRERRLTVNNPTVTVQGPLAVIPRAPLYRGDEFLGLVQVVVEIDPLLEDAAQSLGERFQFQLRDATGALFWGPETLGDGTVNAIIPVGDNRWTLTIGWRNAPPVPDPFVLVLIWGGGGALLLSLLFILNRAWARTEWLRQAVADRTEALEAEVTQRRQTEARLRESEAHLQAILNSAPIVIIATDKHGTFTLSEGTGLKRTGLKPGQVVGQSAFDLYGSLKIILPDGNSISGEELLARVFAGETLSGITELNGTFFDNRFAPIIDGNGLIKGMVGVSIDITERRQAEEAFQSAESRFRTLVENSSDEISIITADGRLLYESPTNNPTLGYPRDAFREQNIFQLLHPDDLERVQTLFGQLLREPTLQIRDQFRLRHQTGAWIWVEAVGTNLIAEPSVGGIVINYHDITSRKLAENKTRQQLDRMTILRKIDQAIAGSMDLHSVLEIILSNGLDELRVDAAVILLYDPVEQILKFELGAGMHTEALKFTHLKLGDGYAGRAAQAMKTVHIPQLQAHGNEFQRSPDFPMEGFESYFGVPLIAKGEIKGVLEIFRRAPSEPEQDWLDFLETLAGQAAIAIDNAELFESLQRANIELDRRVDERTAELKRLNLELQHANRAKDEFLAN